MGTHRLSVHVAAPRERVFDLWINLERMKEWVGGVTKVTDVTGPVDQAGTRYTVWFGSMRSKTEVLEGERPRFRGRGSAIRSCEARPARRSSPTVTARASSRSSAPRD